MHSLQVFLNDLESIVGLVGAGVAKKLTFGYFYVHNQLSTSI